MLWQLTPTSIKTVEKSKSSQLRSSHYYTPRTHTPRTQIFKWAVFVRSLKVLGSPVVLIKQKNSITIAQKLLTTPQHGGSPLFSDPHDFF